MGRIRERLRANLLTTLSGDPDGRPRWVEAIRAGGEDPEHPTDSGFFGPGSAAWAVHGGIPTLVAGIRALLLQTLHPGAMAGVHDWSRYKEDPLGRLAGTIQWVLTTTFADSATAERESTRVSRYHVRVAGDYVDARGVTRPYAASDPELLAWVHIVFTDAFLRCHQTWGGPIPGGADGYVREWARAGDLVGVTDAPRSEEGLRRALDAFREAGTLKSDERVADAVRFIRSPFGSKPSPAYSILFAGAVATIPEEYRRMLGLRRAWWPAVTATRLLLAVVRRVLGPSTSERAALERIDRIL